MITNHTPRLRILQLFQEGTSKHLTAEEVYREIARSRGFQIKEHSLALYGFCAACTLNGPCAHDKRMAR
jgi:Fe2+ or Zn2+ uptake regulation protein